MCTYYYNRPTHKILQHCGVLNRYMIFSAPPASKISLLVNKSSFNICNWLVYLLFSPSDSYGEIH